MQTFTIGFGRSWWIRISGQNPLVRRGDRIEAWVVALMVMVVVLATPFAGAIGTSVHDSRTRLYAEEAQHRHRVTATSIEDGVAEVDVDGVSFTVRARWSAAGREHVEVINWPVQAKIGEQHDIWVNDQGEHSRPPTLPSHAANDALGIALFFCFGVLATAAGVVYAVRWRLNRHRYAEWDRVIAPSTDDGGRKNHQ